MQAVATPYEVSEETHAKPENEARKSRAVTTDNATELRARSNSLQNAGLTARLFLCSKVKEKKSAGSSAAD